MEYSGELDDVYYGDNQQSWWEQEQLEIAAQERADADLEATAEKRMAEAAKEAPKQDK